MNEILRRFAPQNDIKWVPVISSEARNPCDDAHESAILMHRMPAPKCHAERSEASRSSNIRVLFAKEEIL